MSSREVFEVVVVIAQDFLFDEISKSFCYARAAISILKELSVM